MYVSFSAKHALPSEEKIVTDDYLQIGVLAVWSPPDYHHSDTYVMVKDRVDYNNDIAFFYHSIWGSYADWLIYDLNDPLLEKPRHKICATKTVLTITQTGLEEE